MKNLFPQLFACTLALTAFTSCSTEESTEQPVLSVNFKTVTTPFDAGQLKASSSKTAASGSFLFDDGFITLTALRYEAETENDSLSLEFEMEGTVVIDFATGVTTPDIGAIAIPAGTYERVETEVELFDETDEPSVVILGTYTAPGGETFPVRFEFNSGETFEVEREGAVVFSENQTVLAEITFDPSLWFLGVTDDLMAGANQNLDGIIVISETENSNIFDIVADGLDLATELEIIL